MAFWLQFSRGSLGGTPLLQYGRLSKFFDHLLITAIIIMLCFVILTTKKAKKKPLVKKSAEELGVDVTPRHEVLSVEDPPTRTAGQKVETVEELVKKLKDMGLV